MLFKLLEILIGKTLIKSTNDSIKAYTELEKSLIQQGIKDTSFLLNEPEVTKSFVIEEEYDGYYKGLLIASLDFEYNEQLTVSWINFIYDLKKQELNEFLNAIKEDKVYIFNNEIKENNFYVGEYPHLMITIPNGDKIRFIMFACEDCASEEMVLSDIFIDKTAAIKAFEQSFANLEKIRNEEKD